MKTERGMWKHVTLLVISALLLICTVAATFAWMENGGIFEQSTWKLLYGREEENKIRVQNMDISIKFYSSADGESYTEKASVTPDNTADEREGNLLECQNMMPSNAQYFKIEFKNEKDTESRIDVSFAGVSATKGLKEDGTPMLADVLYIALSRTEGYTAEQADIVPAYTYDRISDIAAYSDRSMTIPFIKGLRIPAQSTITVYGYILFDRSAGAEYENMDFSIDNLYVFG